MVKTPSQIYNEYMLLKKIQMGAIVSGGDVSFLEKLLESEHNSSCHDLYLDETQLSRLTSLYYNAYEAFLSIPATSRPEPRIHYIDVPNRDYSYIASVQNASLRERASYFVKSNYNNMLRETESQWERIKTYFAVFVSPPRAQPVHALRPSENYVSSAVPQHA